MTRVSPLSLSAFFFSIILITMFVFVPVARAQTASHDTIQNYLSQIVTHLSSFVAALSEYTGEMQANAQSAVLGVSDSSTTTPVTKPSVSLRSPVAVSVLPDGRYSYVYKFDITASSQDIYIHRGAKRSAGMVAGNGFNYAVRNAANQTVTFRDATSSAASHNPAGGDSSSAYFKVLKGTTEPFTLEIFVTPVVAGTPFKTQLHSINYNTVEADPNQTVVLPSSQFVSGVANGVTTPKGTIDVENFTNAYPFAHGTANVPAVQLWITNGAKTYYGSGRITVKDGQWSHKATTTVPDGSYRMSLSDYSTTKTLAEKTIEIKTTSVPPKKPTVKMSYITVAYNSNQATSNYLFTYNVTAGSQDMYIPAGTQRSGDVSAISGFNYAVRDASGKSIPRANLSSTDSTKSQGGATLQLINNTNVYLVKKGTTATFVTEVRLQHSWKTLNTPYKVQLNSITYAPLIGTAYEALVLTPASNYTSELFVPVSNSDVELKIVPDDATVNTARVIEVDATDDTDNVEVLSFTLEAEGDSDISIDSLPIMVTSKGSPANDPDDIISQLTLWFDGEEIGAEGLSASDSNDNGEVVVFDDLDWDINAGETVEVLVKAKFFSIADTLNEGDKVAFAFGEVETDRADFDIEDEWGIRLSDDQISGSVFGGNFELRSIGIKVSFVSADATVSVDDGSDDDAGTFEIVFLVEAFGGDVYVSNSPAPTTVSTVIASSALNNGIWYLTDKAGTATTADLSDVISFTTNDGATDSGNNILLNEGESSEFTLTVVRQNNGDATDSGVYRTSLKAIGWTPMDSSVFRLHTDGLQDFKTKSVVID